MIGYQRACTNCRHKWVHYCTMADRNDEVPCPECDGPTRRVLTMPRVAWHDVASKSADFPTAEDIWLKDREKRKEKELENVELHGTEYPNLKEA